MFLLDCSQIITAQMPSNMCMLAQAGASVASLLGAFASLEPKPQPLFHAAMMVRVPSD